MEHEVDGVTWRLAAVHLANAIEKIGLPGYAHSLATARNPADAARALHEATIAVAVAHAVARAWGVKDREVACWDALGMIGKARAPIEAALYRTVAKGGGG